jgi:osmoprotectant transport system ATP-binding protein
VTGPPAAIVLHDVSKTYGGKRAVLPTDLEVETGRSVALVGPSGSGKSTLLRLVLGLVDTDTGWVSVLGERVHAKTAIALRRRIGYVIQDGGLFPHLSARDNATLVARHLDWSDERCAKRLDELAALVGLTGAIWNRYPVELSGGERQRVGLVRALMLDPEMLLLDEPLGALDPVRRARLQDDLRAIFRDLRKTVLLVTHDLAEAAYLTDEIAVMHEGVLLQKGSFEQLRERPSNEMVSQFLHAQRLGSIEAAR